MKTKIKFMKKAILIYFALISYLYFSPVIAQETKIGFQMEAGYGFGIDRDYNSAQIFFTPLYKQNEQLSFGIGVGFKYYYDPDKIIGPTKKEKRLISVPVYAAIDYMIPVGRKFQPFINLKAGYGISSRKFHYPDGGVDMPIPGDVDLHETGNFFISPAAGVAYPINHDQTIRLSIAYGQQKLKTSLSNDTGETYNTNFNIKNISLRLSWNF